MHRDIIPQPRLFTAAAHDGWHYSQSARVNNGWCTSRRGDTEAIVIASSSLRAAEATTAAARVMRRKLKMQSTSGRRRIKQQSISLPFWERQEFHPSSCRSSCPSLYCIWFVRLAFLIQCLFGWLLPLFFAEQFMSCVSAFWSGRSRELLATYLGHCVGITIIRVIRLSSICWLTNRLGPNSSPDVSDRVDIVFP